MIVSIPWLKDFVDTDSSARELADYLTNASIETVPAAGGRVWTWKPCPIAPTACLM